MRITELWIRNFKSIREIHFEQIENALILVGKNDTGKTAVRDALRAVSGDYVIGSQDFREDLSNIEIMLCLEITEEDLQRFHREGREKIRYSMNRDIEKMLSVTAEMEGGQPRGCGQASAGEREKRADPEVLFL